MFSIKSTHSDREVVFTKYDGEDFWVELKGGIETSVKVYGYAPHADDFHQWLELLGEQSQPWPKELVWESLEGEFQIRASSDSLGHVHFQVSLRDLRGSYEESFIQVGLETELGQLGKIASQARMFFSK